MIYKLYNVANGRDIAPKDVNIQCDHSKSCGNVSSEDEMSGSKDVL